MDDSAGASTTGEKSMHFEQWIMEIERDAAHSAQCSLRLHGMAWIIIPRRLPGTLQIQLAAWLDTVVSRQQHLQRIASAVASGSAFTASTPGDSRLVGP